MPASMERRVPLPDKNAPSDTPTILPTITTSVRAATGAKCATIKLGLIDIPTDTKKIAANMSRTGVTKCSTSF
jgi:hypothetical protein